MLEAVTPTGDEAYWAMREMGHHITITGYWEYARSAHLCCLLLGLDAVGQVGDLEGGSHEGADNGD